jgi:hypothetical protein
MTAAVVLALAAQAQAAKLTVTPSRTETLYAQSEEQDCTELSKVPSANLPFHVVRLSVESPVTDGTVRYRWSEPSAGSFAADLDLGPDDQTRLIRSLVADLGNACTLTGESLELYDRPTILWIAPTCDALPTDTTRPYPGDRVRFGVQALQGKRRLGKGSVTIGYGRLASTVMSISDPPVPFANFRNGHGKPGGEPVFIDTAWGGSLDLKGQTLPAVQRFVFESDAGTVRDVPPCDDPAIVPTGLDACAVAPLWETGGKQLAQLMVELEDGSALCDNLTVNVRTTDNSVALDVTTTPRAGTFVPGDPLKGNPLLRARVRNTGLGSVTLIGNVLNVETEARVSGTILTETTRIDLRHCSATASQACDSDGDCGADACPTCQPDETCLTADHCSGFGSHAPGCTTNRDCAQFGETCVKVLPLSRISIAPGDSFDLVEQNAPLANVLTVPARIKETWTVKCFNAPDATELLRYKIKPRPDVPPPTP